MDNHQLEFAEELNREDLAIVATLNQLSKVIPEVRLGRLIHHSISDRGPVDRLVNLLESGA